MTISARKSDDQAFMKITEASLGDPFAAYLADDTTRALVAKVAARFGWPETAAEGGGVAAAARVIAVAPPPRILIVDFADSDDPLDDLIALEEALIAGSRVIAVGADNDARLARALLQKGAVDYLVKPFSPETLEELLQELQHEPKSDTDETGRIIAILGSRGGSGASTLAASCAWVLAEDLGQRTTLLDLDLCYGDAALAFNLAPGTGLRDSLETPERIDDLFLDRATLTAGERLEVLAAEEDPSETPQIAEDAVENLLEHLAERSSNVVVDLPRGFAQSAAVFKRADEIILVTVPTLPALRDAIRLQRLIRDVAPSSRIRLVINRADRSGNGQIGRRDVENQLTRKADLVIAEDQDLAAEAANNGQPIAALRPRSPFAVNLRKFTKSITGQANEGGWLRGLVRRGR
ncbi:MAG: pilus assembly protein CpaE [Rhodospirillaceae bacterium]|nr:pilus assembly protein CpaE [Rhodospirillaceae bacterium]MBT6138762.1 pilus assembly protein CpaE [Rhodospirillaceae bacterium]